eukprot:CAMPEP_0113969260 /NCGR_PEP_ID=MMETSP0011_2-20120614/10162_1 /TAXON_ID=101924 /ORGANISM="Rhodosorus marinus" /LENGTH=344 /DNA_ID=CAMNT_0000982785 /DNA_START=184 /DNA_END=1215 /DNA_ORIENTATION=+ /assembly_acc=CAM_ASM_000156
MLSTSTFARRVFHRSITRGIKCQAIRVAEFGDPEQLVEVEYDVPSPSAGNVLVKVEAAGVNPVEIYIRRGKYGKLPELPYTPGTEGAGTVAEIGAGVKGLKVGDRVFLTDTVSGHGTYAQYCLSPSSGVHRLPDNSSLEIGASIGIAYRTAWRALFLKSKMKKGELVLVHGASGGVGMACLQLGKDFGARMIGTAGSPEGMEFVKSLGAEEAFDHTSAEYMKELKEYSPSGYSLILSMRAHTNLGKDTVLVANGGKILIVGAQGSSTIIPRRLMSKEASIQGLMTWNFTEAETKQFVDFISEKLKTEKIIPCVEKKYKLSDAKDAHVHINRNAASKGKVLLEPW